jgi:hypothetical protein
MPRWIETFSKAYIGFEFESQPFTSLPMSDLDSPAARTNFYITDRTKQYFDIAATITVLNNGVAVTQASNPYTLQRLGGIVRFASPLPVFLTDPATTLTPTPSATGGTIPAGVYPVSYTYVQVTGKETKPAPVASVTTTGATSTITTGAAPALPTGATAVNWYVGTAGGGASSLVLQSSTAGVTGVTFGSLPAAGAQAAPTTNGTSLVTISGSSLPVYRMLGAKNVGNTAQRAEIDTTGSGDTDMTGAPGRPKRGGSFTFIPGATIVNAAGKTVGLKTMIETAAKAGTEVVTVTVNDIRDAMQPRDASYNFVGNTDMQRNLNAAIDMPVTLYQAACNDADSYNFIDYVA